jgi:hypothetical protein
VYYLIQITQDETGVYHDNGHLYRRIPTAGLAASPWAGCPRGRFQAQGHSVGVVPSYDPPVTLPAGAPGESPESVSETETSSALVSTVTVTTPPRKKK